MSVVIKCFKTVEPNEPVPPVITKVLFLNASLILFMVIFLLAHISALYIFIFLIATENIASVYFIFYIIQTKAITASYMACDYTFSHMLIFIRIMVIKNIFPSSYPCTRNIASVPYPSLAPSNDQDEEIPF